MTQHHPPNIKCTSKNLILKNYIVCVCCKRNRPNFYKKKKKKRDTPERYNVCQNRFQQKLIRVLFEILKDNFYDYLDETMITQEVKLQNP